MNSSSSSSSTNYVVTNSVSVLVCLLATILVFALKLHRKIVYRLALYQVLAGLILALAQLLQVVMGNYMNDPELYDRVCIALGWIGMYSQWMKLLFTVWVTFHLFCFGVLHKNLKKLEVLYVVTSVLAPAVMAAVPLITRSYGYSPVDGCYIPAYANNATLKTAIIERFALWDGPAMVILLALSTAMAVMVIKLADKVCWRLKHEPSSGGDQFWKALKQLLPLAAFPALFLLFIVPVFIYDIYYSFVTPTPDDNLVLSAYIFVILWSMTSGVTLIVHIFVAQLPVCLRHYQSAHLQQEQASSFQHISVGSEISKTMNSATSFPLPDDSIATIELEKSISDDTKRTLMKLKSY